MLGGGKSTCKGLLHKSRWGKMESAKQKQKQNPPPTHICLRLFHICERSKTLEFYLSQAFNNHLLSSTKFSTSLSSFPQRQNENKNRSRGRWGIELVSKDLSWNKLCTGNQCCFHSCVTLDYAAKTGAWPQMSCRLVIIIVDFNLILCLQKSQKRTNSQIRKMWHTSFKTHSDIQIPTTWKNWRSNTLSIKFEFVIKLLTFLNLDFTKPT